MDDELLSEFQSESKSLIGQLLELLEAIEGDYSQHQRLEEYGQTVDRIMGAAKSLAMVEPERNSALDSIGSYAELCKTISYKASQVHDNTHLYTVVVALLMDATEMLQELIVSLSQNGATDVKAVLSKTFLDRLQWLSQQFGEGLRGSLALKPEAESEPKSIADILKALGV